MTEYAELNQTIERLSNALARTWVLMERAEDIRRETVFGLTGDDILKLRLKVRDIRKED